VPSGDYFSSVVESSALMAVAVEALRESLTGGVLVEGDREYESARRCFNLLIDRRPAVIAATLRLSPNIPGASP
jgi:hypothetical protein